MIEDIVHGISMLSLILIPITLISMIWLGLTPILIKLLFTEVVVFIFTFIFIIIM